MKLFSELKSQRGFSLIEILAAMMILTIIIVSMLPMFTQSARTNSFSKNIIDATYVAEANMETVYNVVSTVPSLDGVTIPLTNATYGFTLTTKDCPTGICFEKTDSGHYVFVQIVNSGGANEMAKVKVKVFKDSTKAIKEAQMETLLTWNQ
ncbi:type IV pilus modification PilV family protein [Bacillus sp. FJAT-27245]|uniref:type IV pilus modification PilV family protein n=1 Tax=Bacillus sp. FJAT-27245 TaxID=1684144 RepID=UPI0006A7A995|nr:type II secretion system protein [Bacillus sp. FJAT-27245]